MNDRVTKFFVTGDVLGVFSVGYYSYSNRSMIVLGVGNVHLRFVCVGLHFFYYDKFIEEKMVDYVLESQVY